MARSAPPPLKKEPAPSKGSTAPPLKRVRDDRDVGDAVEKSGAAMRAPGDDEDATKGEWLFKQNDMVLGPVTAIVLVERIKQGELSADTPIARDGQPFKPMKLVALFREAHEATIERKKREAEERAYNAAVRRAKTLRALLLAVMFLGPAAGGAVGGHMLMILQPWDRTGDWIAKAPPLVDLPPRPPEVKKVDTPPTPAGDDGARDDAKDDDEKDDGKRVALKGKDKKKDTKKDAKADDKKDEAKKDEEKKDEAKDDSKTFVKELTNEQAVAPLKDPAVKGPLGACFKAEMEANPDMPSQLNLSYTITEAGRSANVELTNRELRGRPVQACVKSALANARWPRFEGERKNVTVPFNIKKPKPPPTGPVTGGAPK